MSDREQRTILIVDGSAPTLFYFSMLLKRLEYTVVTAGSAEDALRLMEDAVPSIVLTDLALPRMNGISFLKGLKETARFKDIPVVILSTDNDAELQDTCRRMGSAAYLVKPIAPDLLYRTIQKVSEFVPRAHIRLSTSLTVIVGDGSVTGGARRTESATALSEGGLFVKTRYPQPRNAQTPVVLFINDREITAKAEVIYRREPEEGSVDEPGMGMKFVEISDAARELIRDFIKEQLTKDIPSQ